MDDTNDRGYSRAPELEDLVALCKALNQEGVRYVLIGGFAIILHGYVRATKGRGENIQRLKRAMATLPDSALDLIADDEVERYSVVRVSKFPSRTSHAESERDSLGIGADGQIAAVDLHE